MKTYKVYVNWELTGTVMLKAPSIEDAEERAQAYANMGLVPSEAEVVEGTAKVLPDVTEEIKNG